MRLLLDTHVLLWALAEPKRLGRVCAEIEAITNQVLFSAASIWEIAIKFALRRAEFAISPDAILDAALQSGFAELPIRSAAAVRVASLPPHHRDPFDRLLVAQAITEPAALYTADAQLAKYSELVHVITPA
jgi:PIN domain nuclease of toxin-antitoxin system